MQKHEVAITIVAKVFAETEQDLIETVRNSDDCKGANRNYMRELRNKG